MILFDKFEDALEEAEWCAKTYRAIYYIVLWKGQFRVSRKRRIQLTRARLEVGFRND
jgi:hypothetical protein